MYPSIYALIMSYISRLFIARPTLRKYTKFVTIRAIDFRGLDMETNFPNNLVDKQA